MPGKKRWIIIGLIIMGIGLGLGVCWLGYIRGENNIFPYDTEEKVPAIRHALEEERELSHLILNNYKGIKEMQITYSEVNQDKTEYRLSAELTLTDSTEGMYNFVIHMDPERYTITYSSDSRNLETGISSNATVQDSAGEEIRADH